MTVYSTSTLSLCRKVIYFDRFLDELAKKNGTYILLLIGIVRQTPTLKPKIFRPNLSSSKQLPMTYFSGVTVDVQWGTTDELVPWQGLGSGLGWHLVSAGGGHAAVPSSLQLLIVLNETVDAPAAAAAVAAPDFLFLYP